MNKDKKTKKQTAKKQKIIEEGQQIDVQKEMKKTKLDSIDELGQFFEDLNYTSSNWKSKYNEVPRLYLSEIPETWRTVSDTLPVKEKKDIFFQLITPLILISNEAILEERKRLLKEPIDSEWTKRLALKYRVIKKDDTCLTEEKLEKLKKRVDIIPPSLAFA